MKLKVEFEIREHDELGTYTWQEAMDRAAEIGDGWRLPTREELAVMHAYEKIIKGFRPVWYWSVYKTGNAWSQGFGSGDQVGNYVVYDFRVRLVRNIQEATE